jgi:hypothetical protein
MTLPLIFILAKINQQGEALALMPLHINAVLHRHIQCGIKLVNWQRHCNNLQLQFTIDWGIPRRISVDGALEQVGPKTEFQLLIQNYDIAMHISAPHSPQQNPAEGII